MTLTFIFTVALTCALSLSVTLSHRLTLKHTAYVDLNVDADVYMFMYTNIFNHCEEAMCFFNAQCCHTTVHCVACHLTVENVVIGSTDPAQSCLRFFLRMCDLDARLLSSSPDQTFAPELLWNFNRLRTGLTCGGEIFLVVWSPFGAVLCILRCIFLVLAIVFYPLFHRLGLGNWYARFWLPILGYFVTIRGRDNLRASSAPIVVSNHTSDFDACAMWAALPPSQLALVMNDHWKSVVDKVRSVGWPMVAIFTSGADTKDKIKEALPHGSPPPHRVLMFPEGCTCSGIAVQQFNWFVFGLAIL